MTPRASLPRNRQRGAALLMAMMLMALVASLAGAMVWQQWRAVQVEAAERARSQAAWILNGALDWARLILREDARSGRPTALTEPWAVPLAEARLSTFLAADRDNNVDTGPEAFLAGAITDAQSRYNLRNVVKAGKVDAAELAILTRICIAAGLSDEVAKRLADGLRSAAEATVDSPLAPRTLAQLDWLGLDAASIDRLRDWVDLLPVPTPLNLNTASAGVIAAVWEGLDAGSAERLVDARKRQPFKTVEDARPLLPPNLAVPAERVATLSQYFEVRGRLRLDDRVLEERSMVERRGLDVVVILRERMPSVLGPS